jgi:hypothetical protein
MFDRDSAFSMEIRDPNDPDDRSPIVQMLTIGDELLIFKETSLHKGLTADTIDPEKSDPSTRHSSELLYSVGTANSFVARMILQFRDMIGLAVPEAARQNTAIQHVWEANKLLLECEKAYYHIYKHAIDLMPKCDEIVETHKDKPTIPAIPKIPDLKTHVSDFLINGKKFIVSGYKLLSFFYGMPMDGRNEAHFDKHREWIKAELGEKHPIYKVLEADEPWVRLIAECSNAIRHEEVGLKLEIENFTLKPGNKIAPPAWRHDLTKKKGLARQDHYTDLIRDMDVWIYNMLTFFEELLLLCLQDELKGQKLLTIFRRTNAQINPKCPIVYEINLKAPIAK